LKLVVVVVVVVVCVILILKPQVKEFTRLFKNSKQKPTTKKHPNSFWNFNPNFPNKVKSARLGVVSYRYMIILTLRREL
jgi:hypothetical protein